MAFTGTSVWRLVEIREGKEIVVDRLLAQSGFLTQTLARKRTVNFLGMALPFVTLEDSVLLKVMAGRLQDRADLERIKQQPGLPTD